MAKNNISEVLKQAENGIRQVFDDEKYKEYLRAMGKFHNYSLRNIILIQTEKPDATYVAGYKAWQKDFDRYVKKGEKGIPIIAYTPRIKYQEKLEKDENGIEKPTLIKHIIPHFKVVYVYDISQTDGKPLPKLIENLQGNVSNYEDLFQSIKEVAPYKIEFEKIDSGANGYCDLKRQEIKIREGMSQKQNIKTAIHETAHAEMHSGENKTIDRSTAEVEAEAVAYAVCEHFGLDTSSYSFTYIATWSSGKELKELEEHMDRIQHKASELITKIETKYLELNPPETDINTRVDGEHIQNMSVDEVLKPEVVKACLSYEIPVGYYSFQNKDGRQCKELSDAIPVRGSEQEYSTVFKDIKLSSQLKGGIGEDSFCYYESSLNTPTINPMAMNGAEIASTNYLISKFMEQDNWTQIDEYLKYNAPVSYDTILSARDKFCVEEKLMEAPRDYRMKSEVELRNLAGYVTISDETASFPLKGEEGLWNVMESKTINGDKYFMMYNEMNPDKTLIVDRNGSIQCRNRDFGDLYDRLEEERYMLQFWTKAKSKEDSLRKKKDRGRER